MVHIYTLSLSLIQNLRHEKMKDYCIMQGVYVAVTKDIVSDAMNYEFKVIRC